MDSDRLRNITSKKSQKLQITITADHRTKQVIWRNSFNSLNKRFTTRKVFNISDTIPQEKSKDDNKIEYKSIQKFENTKFHIN